jgi:hypothetical protein
LEEVKEGGGVHGGRGPRQCLRKFGNPEKPSARGGKGSARKLYLPPAKVSRAERMLQRMAPEASCNQYCSAICAQCTCPRERRPYFRPHRGMRVVHESKTSGRCCLACQCVAKGSVAQGFEVAPARSMKKEKKRTRHARLGLLGLLVTRLDEQRAHAQAASM